MSSATSLLATAGVWNQGAVDLYLEPPANISSQTAQNPQGEMEDHQSQNDDCVYKQ